MLLTGILCLSNRYFKYVPHISHYRLQIQFYSTLLVWCTRRNYLISCQHFSTCRPSLKPPWKILFFGSDIFAVKSLEALCSKLRTNTLISTLEVCSTSAVDWRKKHNPVYEFTNREKLPFLEWPLDADNIRDKYDIGIVVSFGYLIPEDIITRFPLGILNVHGSVLPRWRGAAPIIRAIMNGDTETGVTIMKISPHQFDVGDIVRQYTLSVLRDETAAQLTTRLADIGARLLMECVRDLPRSVQYTTPQPEDGVCYAKKVTASSAAVDWSSKSAEEVYNMHRALSHLYPLTTSWFGLVIKIMDLRRDDVTEMNPENKTKLRECQMKEAIIPGLVEFSRRRSCLRVQCKDGKWVCINSVTISGKKKLTASEFYNGYLSKVKNSLDRKFTFS